MLVMLSRLRVHHPSNVQCILGVHASLSLSLNQLHACFSNCSASPSSTAAGADKRSCSAEGTASCYPTCTSSHGLGFHNSSISPLSSSSSNCSSDSGGLESINRPQQHRAGGQASHRAVIPQQQQLYQYQYQHHGQHMSVQQQQPSMQRRQAWQCPPATGLDSWAQQQLWQQHPQGQPHKQHLQWLHLQQLRHSSSSAGRDNLWQEYSSAATAAAQQQQQQSANKQLPPDVNFIPLPGRMAPVRRSPQRRGAAAAAAAAGRVAPEPAWAVLEQARQDQRQSRSGMQQYNRVEPQEKLYPVDALHLGAAIDVANFANEYKSDFADVISNPPHRDHSIFLLKISNDDQDMLNPGSSEPVPRYMIVYRYGSVIFMNVPEDERKRQLALLKPFIIHQQGQEAAAAAADENTSTLRTDKTTIVVRPHLEEWSDLEDDQIVVQQLDLSGMRVISHVLSQSVALDYFNWRVDNAIQQFTPYLTAVAQTGACDTVKEARLLQLIADNSLLYTDVVTKIGLLDMNPTAWKNDKHYKLWEDLRLDYEIDRRFDAINRKLGPMLENAKFLLDVRAEQKSSGAEWIIIGLICLEVLMNGFGHLAAYFW